MRTDLNSPWKCADEGHHANFALAEHSELRFMRCAYAVQIANVDFRLVLCCLH